MFYLSQVEDFVAGKKVEEVLADCVVGTLTYWNILHLIEEMPQVETRLILVQEAGKQEELLKAVKVRKWSL